jgi:hypothetical protein
MRAFGDELRKPGLRRVRCVGPRDPDRVETELTGGLRQSALERKGIVQKSRSA